jgi:hypothetical protein
MIRGDLDLLAKEVSERRVAVISSADISASSGTQFKSCPVECRQSSGLRVRVRGRGVSVVVVVLIRVRPICPVLALQTLGASTDRPLGPGCVDTGEIIQTSALCFTDVWGIGVASS